MYISARERRIIELLGLKSEETTVKDLSKELKVSSRTIHRDLKGVEDILRKFELKLDKKAGTGIKIVGDEKKREKLQLSLFNISHNEYTPEERQTIILTSLLDTSEPVKLVSLANDLNVTIATISNDLNKVEEQIEPYGLTLLRKRGYGVEIRGEESAKRKVMSKLILNNLDEFEFMSIIKENIQKRSTQSLDTITNRLLGLVDKKKLLIIEKQVDEIKKNLPYTIADSSYIGLVVHLALAIERIQHGEEIAFDADTLENFKHTKEFEVAKMLVGGLEDVLGITISHGEIGYITMHLMGAKLRNDHEDFLEDKNISIGFYIHKLISFVSQKLEYDLNKNLPLFQGLVSHLKPAIYRIKQNMGITNPLLSKIEDDYKELFTVIEEGVTVTFPELNVPKEEIGYLVMHFASALINRDITKEYKALVVCSSGIGTSKFLSTRLEYEIPGIKTQNLSLFELDSIVNYQYDVIVSTIPLKNFNDEYILVSPMLSKQEVEQVRKLLVNKNKVGSSIAITKNEPKQTNTDKFLLQLEKTMHYSTAIFHVINGFKLYQFEKALTSKEVIDLACESLAKAGIISDHGQVMKSLQEREKLGGLGIPDTSLALYHARSEYIHFPSFTIYRLEHPLMTKAMDDSQIEIKTILLMLSPMHTNEVTIEVLSTISSLIIRNKGSIEEFQSASENELYKLLVKELNTLYDLKTN